MMPLETAQLLMAFFQAVIAREVVNVGDKKPVSVWGRLIINPASSSKIQVLLIIFNLFSY
jgi:hypothetical protein